MTALLQPSSEGTPLACLPPHLRKPRLNRREASEYLMLAHGISRKPATLAKLHCVGGGPVVEYANRSPLYPRSGLDTWAEALIGPPVHSTSEVAHP